MRKEILIKILKLLLDMGYVPRQGYADFTILVRDHKIVKIIFADEEKF
jgi:hypothetical protein